MTPEATVLLSMLFVGHFFGDFTFLSTPRMQEAKRTGRPIGPIALHALVHAVLVAIAVGAIVRPQPMLLLGAVAIEFWTHLAVDWFRGRLTARHPAIGNPEESAFWTVLGLDQLAHALVLLGIAYLVLL
jgi:hypothetical protein